MKRVILCMLALVMAASLAFAGGSREAAGSSSSERVVTTVCRASYANEVWYNEMNKAFEEETGIRVIVQPTPGNDADHDAKINIDLTAGSRIDVVPSLGPKFYEARVEAGFFEPLSKLVNEKGVDAEAMYGANLPVEADGDYYGLPSKVEAYCVFYNKDLFDRAGIPYPSGAWTWDDYQELAIALTDADAGIYGSFMNAENPWYIIQATQAEDPLYTADGKCNFDTPLRREAIEWHYQMGNVFGCQMPVSEIQNENVSWNYYAMAGDHLAMFVQGNWFTRLLNSQEDYPRDWKYGLTVTPSGKGENGNNNIVSAAYNSINVNAEHPEEALEYVIWLADNQWRFEGGIPAYAEMSEEDRTLAFGAVAEASDGQITVDDLYSSLVDNGMGSAQSDIIGVAADEYNRIANEELTMYFLDLQSLDVTMANITRRVNEAIASYV